MPRALDAAGVTIPHSGVGVFHRTHRSPPAEVTDNATLAPTRK